MPTGVAEASLEDELKKTRKRVRNLDIALALLVNKDSAYKEEMRLLIRVFGDHVTRVESALVSIKPI